MSCSARIQVGHEAIECYAGREHEGRHMAMALAPCGSCGGYDLHAERCPAFGVMGSWPGSWWSWADGDLALTLEPDDAGDDWYLRMNERKRDR
ncbi:MAG: hypothetical protein ACRD2W_02155 [Acidimicrobiales bacterium]